MSDAILENRMMAMAKYSRWFALCDYLQTLREEGEVDHLPRLMQEIDKATDEMIEHACLMLADKPIDPQDAEWFRSVVVTDCLNNEFITDRHISQIRKIAPELNI